MTMAEESPALIVGAGIGGLAAAIALRRAGREVVVLERVPELNEAGSGLSLWPNAVKALRKLGLQAFVDEQGHAADIGAVYTWRGKTLAQTTTSDVERGGGVPLAVSRAELLAALRSAVASLTPGASVVRFGAQVVRFEQDPSGVTVHFADGQHARGSMLIGADGLRSVVRSQLFGAEPPRYAGFTAWRAVVPAPRDQPLLIGEFWGAGQVFGIVPIGHERIYWFATRNAREGEIDTPAERKREILARFTSWYPAIPALIQSTPEEAILRNDIYDRPPLAAWSRGRVTLLGDAAHPMTPNLGQGACQALEDAVILGASLSGTTDIPQALRAYQAARLPRANMIAQRSRQMSDIVQRSGPLARWARDTLVRAMPSAVRLKQLKPITGYEV
ncbi:MAG TPA: FAD-dependent monooxygenase [Ktedonobacterales bacterium]